MKVSLTVEAMHPLDDTNVFVKYLPSTIDDIGLSELFQPCGIIKSAKVMVDHQTGLSLGFGFVRFSAPDEAQEAIVKMSGYRVQNKILLCKLSNCSSNSIASEPSTNLYIKPLLPNTTETDLVELFEVFGPVAAAKVMVDKVTGESKQIGFVRFEELEHATAALHAMNGYKITNDNPALIVKYAETESQRAMRKSKQGSLSSPSPPPSPTGTSYYYPQQLPMYSPMATYMPYPYTQPYYVTMLSYSPSTPAWSPPYVVSAEQAGY